MASTIADCVVPFVDCNVPGVVTEWCPYEIQAAILQLETAQKVQAAISICRAVEAMHEIGLVHCDLRPENVMYNNRARLTDFGGTTEEGSPVCQYHEDYAAPEVLCAFSHEDLTDENCCPRAHSSQDVFSLATLLEEIMPGIVYRNDQLHYIITGCLDHDPAERPAVSELLSALACAE
jgi:serine/threonine protein kinase